MNKTCSKCGISKPLDKFYSQKDCKDGRRPDCKECVKKRGKKYKREHQGEILKKSRKYGQEHREERAKYHKEWYEKTGREMLGHSSMYKNKLCSSYLGIVIGERLCRHLFKDVEVMPMHNPGFDIICNKGKKIDVKTSSTRKGKYPSWKFHIEHNTIADYFICVAFDNRTDLNPLHLWMIPGNEVNHLSGAQISLSTIHKWDKYKKDINDAQLCCAELKESNHEV